MDGRVDPEEIRLAIGQRVPEFVQANVPDALGRVSSQTITRIPPTAVVLVMAHPGTCRLEEVAADAGYVCLRMFDPRMSSAAPETRADDLVFVGASREEILWRAGRAIELRRASAPAAPPRLESDGLWHNGRFLPLSASEVRVLQRLMDEPDRPVSQQALSEVLGHRTVEPRALEAHLYRLRRKLQALPGLEIRTVRQRGFRWHVGTVGEAAFTSNRHLERVRAGNGG